MSVRRGIPVYSCRTLHPSLIPKLFNQRYDFKMKTVENITTSQSLPKLTFEPVSITVVGISSAGRLCSASQEEPITVSINEMNGNQLI